MTITDFLLARFAEDEAAAGDANVRQGDPSWTAHKLGDLGVRAFRVRSDRDCRPVATVEDVGDDEDGPTSILDGEAVATHIARWDPARVLAECAAKRRIVEEVAEEATGLDERVDSEWLVGSRDEHADPYLGDILLRLLALPYADHPDYDEAWRR